MQHSTRQQEQQTCVLQEERQQFIAEISALGSLAEEAGVTGSLLNASTPNLRNHSGETPLKPADRPKEGDSHSA